MKLVIAGANGFVGKEILRQALRCSTITSVVTLGRRPVVTEDYRGAIVEDQYKSKLTDIVLDDLKHYPEAALKQIANADACVWTIAVAFTKSKTTPFDIVKKVTRDYTLAGLRALSEMNQTGKSLRFIYFSGAAASRNVDEIHPFVTPEMVPYVKLRNTVEVELIEYATKPENAAEICCVRPAYILGDRGPGHVAPQYLNKEVPTVKLEECVAAVLKQAVEGIELDPIENKDLGRIGAEATAKYFSN